MSLAPSVARKSLQVARIVIIGAGASGIAAATKLLEAGCQNVIVLEAENRIGGRIYTIPYGDNVVDLGAQWCHGEEKNAVYEMVQKKNLDVLEKTETTYEDYKCLRSNKEILDDDQAETLKTVSFFITDVPKELENYEGSLGAFMTEKYWSGLEKLPVKVNSTLAKEFFENYKKFRCSIEAADHLFEVSARGYLQYCACEGDLLWNWKQNGYKRFLEILMNAQAPKVLGVLEKRILLNHRVQNIDWQQQNEVKIKCFNGQVITADHVICTTSLGVLKENHSTLFTPSLPVTKLRAIEGLKIGTVDKFFMEFEEPFGPPDWLSVCFLWQEKDLEELRNSSLFWLESVFGFFRVSHQPKLLQGWIIGPHARHMESLPEAEVLNGLLWLFRKFFNFPIPQPISFKRTQWHSNVSFRGSYTFRSMYTEELRTGAWDLATPLTDSQGKPKLQFAGEATHNHFYSTVHGAVETGWREAQRLMDFYKFIPSQL